MPVPFGGLGVALVTLFDDRDRLRAAATAEHAARLVDLGVRLVLVCGSTGEAASLTPDEREELIAAVRAAVPATVPVLAGTGAATAEAAAGLTARARAAGADAVLALSPPGSARLPDYYAAVVAAAGPLPVLAYHFPTVSTPGIPLDVLRDLPVVGLKDSSRDPERLHFELTRWDQSVFVGSASMVGLGVSLGAAGAILAIANAEPEMAVAALAGDTGAQQRLAERSREADSRFPLGIKEMTARRFGTSAARRQPDRVAAGED